MLGFHCGFSDSVKRDFCEICGVWSDTRHVCFPRCFDVFLLVTTRSLLILIQHFSVTLIRQYNFGFKAWFIFMRLTNLARFLNLTKL